MQFSDTDIGNVCYSMLCLELWRSIYNYSIKFIDRHRIWQGCFLPLSLEALLLCLSWDIAIYTCMHFCTCVSTLHTIILLQISHQSGLKLNTCIRYLRSPSMHGCGLWHCDILLGGISKLNLVHLTSKWHCEFLYLVMVHTRSLRLSVTCFVIIEFHENNSLYTDPLSLEIVGGS